MNLLDTENHLLDAEFSMDVLEGAPCIVVESSGGGNPAKGIARRNPDYNKLLSMLFQRLAKSGVKITKVVLDSAKVSKLPVNERVAELREPYPVDLRRVDIESFRKELQREVSLMHRSPSAKTGGNAQKKIRICIDRNIDFESLVYHSGLRDPEQETPTISSGLNETEKEYIRTARIGQGQFRKSLIESYKGRCPITGIENEQLLIASHIKPWSKCTNAERLDPKNGILLSALVDRLFDQGLISFKDDGSVLVSPTLSENDINNCAIDSWPRVSFPTESNHYLEYHRAVEFKCT